MSKKSEQLDADGKKMLEYIEKSASRMAEMIYGLLDYARMGDSKELILTDLNELVKTVLVDLDSSVSDSSAIIKLENLPTIQVYSMQMRLLFQNLISNALKYKKPDIPPRITISAAKVKNGWEFTIEDNGIGIPENQKENVFNLFHRLHGKNKYDGSGIGLAHCRKIAELHKGRIWVESELGAGSRFCFFIPSKLNYI
jgi:light-regulated signal transduction histidine kinase (bacteriophytochrome)